MARFFARALRLRRSSGEIGGLSVCSGRGAVRLPEPAGDPEYLGSFINLLLRKMIATIIAQKAGKCKVFL
jgi:hypothetical protein